jgi:hypothetical protein
LIPSAEFKTVDIFVRKQSLSGTYKRWKRCKRRQKNHGRKRNFLDPPLCSSISSKTQNSKRKGAVNFAANQLPLFCNLVVLARITRMPPKGTKKWAAVQCAKCTNPIKTQKRVGVIDSRSEDKTNHYCIDCCGICDACSRYEFEMPGKCPGCARGFCWVCGFTVNRCSDEVQGCYYCAPNAKDRAHFRLRKRLEKQGRMTIEVYRFLENYPTYRTRYSSTQPGVAVENIDDRLASPLSDDSGFESESKSDSGSDSLSS